jgi:hypothetical protein
LTNNGVAAEADYLVRTDLSTSTHTNERRKAYSVLVTRSSKAALLSGLIFPGIGHLFLKRYRRGSVLMLLALIAFWVVVSRAYDRAMSVVDRILSGDIQADPGAIQAAVSAAGTGTDALIENVAVIVLLVCWIAGIIDSYRLGAAEEEKEMQPAD